MTTETPTPCQPSAAAGKYLSFKLARESYGVPVQKVREIIRLCAITPVPRVPHYIKGVINLRGKIIPVVDLRLKFETGPAEDTLHTCIIVVQHGALTNSTLSGLIVDAVEEVANIGANEIEPPPQFSADSAADHIVGMAKTRGSVKVLLDIDQVLSGSATNLAPRAPDQN
jgi:purine-binding chemotaxis protein CheW